MFDGPLIELSEDRRARFDPAWYSLGESAAAVVAKVAAMRAQSRQASERVVEQPRDDIL